MYDHSVLEGRGFSSQNHQEEDIPVRVAHNTLRRAYTLRRTSLITTKNGHVRGPIALSPAPNCAYYATLFTKSHVTTATSITSGALYALSAIV